jgi:hypothetical protein
MTDYKNATEFALNALEQEDAPDFGDFDPTAPVQIATESYPNTWFPANTMEKMRQSDNPMTQYLDIVRLTVAKYVEGGNVDEAFESVYPSPEANAAEAYHLAPRIAQGFLTEVEAYEDLEARYDEVLDTEDALDLHDEWQTVKDMEEDGVDFIAVTEDNEYVIVQVKTSKDYDLDKHQHDEIIVGMESKQQYEEEGRNWRMTAEK